MKIIDIGIDKKTNRIIDIELIGRYWYWAALRPPPNTAFILKVSSLSLCPILSLCISRGDETNKKCIFIQGYSLIGIAGRHAELKWAYLPKQGKVSLIPVNKWNLRRHAWPEAEMLKPIACILRFCLFTGINETFPCFGK